LDQAIHLKSTRWGRTFQSVSIRPNIWAALLALGMFTLFISVQLITGATWDEDLHRYGYYEITSFAYDVLNGNFSRDFETIYADLEYYGLIPIFPAAWLTDIIAQLFKLDQMQSGTVFRWLLHFTGLLWGTGTVVLVYHILKRLTENTKIALLGSAFLMLYPTWLGHSFFNYKDLALGFFYTLALYGAFKAYSEDPKAYKDGVIILVVATIGAATTKLVGAPLLIVQWICVFLAALKLGPVQARLKALTLAGLITVIGTYVLTPAAWLEPIRFVIESISYMSYHEWAGCTLTDGICLRPSAEDWSAMTYLSGWLGARWPLLLLVTIVPTSLYLAWRGKTLERILLAAAFLPLLLIAARDSALYTGIRHLLFIMPALICCMFVAGHQITQNHTRIRKGASALLFASMAMFVVDNVQLYPYNYVYFNDQKLIMRPPFI